MTAQPPATEPVPPARPAPAGPYLPTIVSGLIVLTVTVLIAVTSLTDFDVDLALALPVGMVATGALLILGAVVAVLAGSRRGSGE